MERIEVVGPDGLDYDAVLELQHRAFPDVMTPAQIEANLNRGYYAWEHHPPAGDARIAMVHDGDRLVGMTSMFPVHLTGHGRRLRGWQACQAAAHPSARGRGLFSRCLKALLDSLGPEEVFFGFPNRNSTRGFEKAGCRVLADLRTWARPLPGLRLPGSIEPIFRFEERHQRLLSEYSQGEGMCIERSIAYLNWRYFAHPNFEYGVYAHREGAAPRGILVLGTTTLFGVRCALVMECLATADPIESLLMRAAAAWASRRGAPVVLMVCNTSSPSTALRAGFLPIPSRWTPRRMVLLGQGMSAPVDALVRGHWRTQLGDWDVF